MSGADALAFVAARAAIWFPDTPEANLGATAAGREAASVQKSGDQDALVRPHVLPISTLNFRYSHNTQCISAWPQRVPARRHGGSRHGQR